MEIIVRTITNDYWDVRAEWRNQINWEQEVVYIFKTFTIRGSLPRWSLNVQYEKHTTRAKRHSAVFE